MSSNLTPPANLQQRLLARKNIVPSGCWEWHGALQKNGYGRIRLTSRHTTNIVALTHRASYEAFVGPIPAGMDVCHRCDNPKCINPEHLFIGTRADNMQDCIAKGRFVVNPRPRGEANPQCKLTDAQVVTIRSSTTSSIILGKEFGVSARYVRGVRSGRWRAEAAV